MTMPSERTRALIWAGEFLQEILLSETAPAELKNQAVHILRHYPGAGEISRAAEWTVQLNGWIGTWLAPDAKKTGLKDPK